MNIKIDTLTALGSPFHTLTVTQPHVQGVHLQTIVNRYESVMTVYSDTIEPLEGAILAAAAEIKLRRAMSEPQNS